MSHFSLESQVTALTGIITHRFEAWATEFKKGPLPAVDTMAALQPLRQLCATVAKLSDEQKNAYLFAVATTVYQAYLLAFTQAYGVVRVCIDLSEVIQACMPKDAPITEEPYFEVKGACGRVWHVAFSSVRDDYVAYLMHADNLSEQDARARVDDSLLECWFCEQFYWPDVTRVGVQVQGPTAQQVDHALNFLQANLAQGVGECSTLVNP